MCEISGFSSFRRNLLDGGQKAENWGGKWQGEKEVYMEENIIMGNKIYKHQDNAYIMACGGQIYNTPELKRELISAGVECNGANDKEVLLKSFIHWGHDIVNKLNGNFAFAIWDKNKQELFLARDHFGVKPLFYTESDDMFIFSSNIKTLLEFPGIRTQVDAQGISELFGLGPAHTGGTTVFKNIFELKPAHYMVFNKSGLYKERYWKFVSKKHEDDFDTTCKKTLELLESSIERQMISDTPLCTFLSGGIDSSIVTLYASNYCKENNLPTLKTYSVDYLDNDKNFVKSDFQPNTDKHYIDIMTEKLGTNHSNIVLDTPDLALTLIDAMMARDCPGMADVDSSLLLFCKIVKDEASVAITGECADEIFAGYPWFYREDALNSGTFPWSLAVSERQQMLNKSISSRVNLKEYIDFRFSESLANVEILDTDSQDTAEKRKISYLTMNWFMQTLLDRADRMAEYSGMELRVPFCDYVLAEYLWNVPFEMKAYNGREKGLLRHIMKGKLPDEIIERKKSPYPKTHNPSYLKTVKEMLQNIINDSNAQINNLIDRNMVLNILKTDGNAFTRPWFGQLMTGPQLMAYLIQVNAWLEVYKPEIKI